MVDWDRPIEIDLSGLIFWPALLGVILLFYAVIVVPEPWKGIAAAAGLFGGMFGIPLLVGHLLKSRPRKFHEPQTLREVNVEPSGPWTLREKVFVLVVGLLLGFLGLLALMFTRPLPAP